MSDFDRLQAALKALPQLETDNFSEALEIVGNALNANKNLRDALLRHISRKHWQILLVCASDRAVQNLAEVMLLIHAVADENIYHRDLHIKNIEPELQGDAFGENATLAGQVITAAKYEVDILQSVVEGSRIAESQLKRNDALAIL